MVLGLEKAICYFGPSLLIKIKLFFTKSAILMKRFLSLSLFACFCLNFNAFATIRVVNNNLNGPGQFTTIQDAIAAASAGDTIYISPSPTAYTNPSTGTIVVDKRLVFIGAGMRPAEKKDNTALSRIGTRFEVNNAAANGSIWQGLYFQSVFAAINVSANVSNCQVLRNWFDGSSGHVNFNSGSYTGWLIANNYFSIGCGGGISMNNQTSTNFIIQNNVFAENSGCGFQNSIAPIINFSNSANCIVSNNLFYGAQGDGVTNNDQAFLNCGNMIVENNIFHTMSPGGLSNSVINNNITFGTAVNTLPYGSNNGQNNVANTDPQLTSFNNNTFNPNQNFQPAGGPARTGAVGGGQMGVYGGTFNWNNSAVPPIPQIRTFSITSGATVPAGGSLNIRVISTKQN